MKRSLLRIELTILLILLSANGCQGTQIAKESENNAPLRVAYTDVTSDYIILIAEEMGFFEKYGVEIESIYYPNISSAYADISIGDIDALNTGAIDLINIIENNNLRMVMISSSSDGYDAIVAEPTIKTIADLQGKRIGVSFGSYGELLVKNMLNEANIPIAEVTLLNIAPEIVPYAIPSEIDAGFTQDPYLATAIAAGNQVIFSSADTPGLFPTLVSFRAELVQERPADIRSFVSAWLDAADFWKSNPFAGDIIIAQRMGKEDTDISFDGVKIYSLQDNIDAFAQNPGTTTLSIFFTLQISLEFAVSSGFVTSPPNMDIILEPLFMLPE